MARGALGGRPAFADMPGEAQLRLEGSRARLCTCGAAGGESQENRNRNWPMAAEPWPWRLPLAVALTFLLSHFPAQQNSCGENNTSFLCSLKQGNFWMQSPGASRSEHGVGDRAPKTGPGTGWSTDPGPCAVRYCPLPGVQGGTGARRSRRTVRRARR